MARTVVFACVTCGKNYYSTAIFPDECIDCRVSAARVEAERAEREAKSAAATGAANVDEILERAEFEVLREWVLKGDSELETLKTLARYWAAVEQKVKE